MLESEVVDVIIQDKTIHFLSGENYELSYMLQTEEIKNRENRLKKRTNWEYLATAMKYYSEEIQKFKWTEDNKIEIDYPDLTIEAFNEDNNSKRTMTFEEILWTKFY